MQLHLLLHLLSFYNRLQDVSPKFLHIKNYFHQKNSFAEVSDSFECYCDNLSVKKMPYKRIEPTFNRINKFEYRINSKGSKAL